ncbi:3-methyladenine DNA glycosylase Mpg [Bradyrhizobium japonicum]|uniref:hypothetical protein n=1 Tax=Bradyrhizobium TaxID=374 RepID=UPI0012BBC502|nr:MULTISPECIES: hypothetical protein [Bradyrhizobium]MCP1728856.1 3-methyladenine DNA glycosylase Mpg [Bradyrhizobium elkanii]MCP1929364.1 3-methyladenine DNA glycosylase Mpg [Bradyrhizobium elkanii]MCS3473315.1 3-methyladenine DNA glycosylase Mpg [Bradyrhizobium elkanii]MCS3572980.1 3-methyladenine DNA glycosylase Mpg [Bradyrhizobium elkanii]MCS3580023.1 3-methyladenine DNA glycosylase Mpg [Bradyrhizobium elkanii]
MSIIRWQHDIFDIAAASDGHSAALIRACRPNVIETVVQIDKPNPEFVRDAIESLIIRDSYQGVAAEALDRAKEILRAV